MMQAHVITPRSGWFGVSFEHDDVNIVIQCRSYDHARAVVAVYNAKDVWQKPVVASNTRLDTTQGADTSEPNAHTG